ncbi:MAG: S-layer homology domain-containing protein [Clostridiales Family XIII bacterium]|jgi:uncharacterized protein with FMN-binding domain|nr:S-layer homology domain-containing protein [Clostridiales Family XIII bacterium]
MKKGIYKNKFILFCVILALLVSTAAPTFAASVSYKDGVYNGSAEGYGGSLALSVTIEEGAISDITINENNETPDRLASASSVISEIIAEQSTKDISAVSGATKSRTAIINAVNDALSSAHEDSIFESGAGTEQSPFIIATFDQLSDFRDSVNAGDDYAGQYVALSDDIIMSDEEWAPIGLSTVNFAGTFDGTGHVVSGLRIGASDTPSSLANAGFFFSLANSATVRNLGLTDLEIYTASSERTRAGGLAGSNASGALSEGVASGTVVDNCYVTGAIISSTTLAGQISYAGGLIGQTGSYTTIINSYTDITVKSEAGGSNAPYAGGIVAMSGANNLVANCYTLGDVIASTPNTALTGVFIGGLVGMQSGKFYNCYAMGDITVIAKEGATQYTAVGALNGQLISTTGDMDTVFFNTAAVITISGQLSATISTGYGNASASKPPTNAVGYTEAQMTSDTLSSALNQGVKNAAAKITLPEDLILFGWDASSGTVSLTGEAYIPDEIDASIFDSGDGTAESPYIIKTETQLRAFALSLSAKIDYVNTYVRLDADITLGDEDWIPVGEGEYAFAGVFDGAGHAISGLSYDSDGGDKGKNASKTMYIGFVGVLSGTVKNLALTDVNIKAIGKTSLYAGAIAGYTYQDKAVIDSCHVTGVVYGETLEQGNNFVGGISGSLYRGCIVNSWSDVKASSVQRGEYWAEVGGISAMNNRGYILNCYTLGDVYAYAQRELEAGIAAGNLTALQAGVMINSYAFGNLVTSDWAQDVGAVNGNTTGIGQGYFLYYNKNADQNIGGQKPVPAVGVGTTVKTIDEDDGVTILSGFNYELVGMDAEALKSAEFAAALNGNFSKFPVELPANIQLKTWAADGSSVGLTDTAATITVVPVSIYDDAPPAFQAGTYLGRDKGKTTMVQISVSDDALDQLALISPSDIAGSEALFDKIKENPAMINLIEVEGEALLALRNAVAAALDKAKLGDATGYGAVDPAIFAGGSGSQASPYLISTPAQLIAFAASINEDESYAGKYLKLTTDIKLTDAWIPAGGGNATHSFSGVFDGDGHTISDLRIGEAQAPVSYRFAGFIGYINKATVKNISLKNIYINNVYAGAERSFTGALAGGADEMSYFDNCSASGSATAKTVGTNACFIGGLIGFTSGYGNVETNTPPNSYSIFITNSSTDVDVKGTSENGWVYAGGISGSTNRTYIVNCYTLGDVTVHSGDSEHDNLNHAAAGGLVGSNGGYITNSYAMGDMNSLAVSTDVGGFAGRHTGIAKANFIYFNTDAKHKSGSSTLAPTPGIGVTVGGSVVDNVAGKSAADMKTQAFAELLNTNANGLNVAPLPEATWKEWIYDSVSGNVSFKPESTPTPPVTTEPGIEVPETTKPGIEVPETTSPGIEVPETTKPGIEVPETTKPGIDKPDNKPSSTVPGKGGSTGGTPVKAPTIEAVQTPNAPFTNVTANAANPFTDVSAADWFYSDVVFAYENNLFNGTSASAFSPYAPMTRGMLVTVLYRFHGASPASDFNNPFSDVPAGAWYSDAVNWAANNKLVNGVSAESFAPDAEIKRQDLAALIQRYLDFSGKSFPVTLQYVSFADNALISDYAQNAVQTLFVSGIMTGKPENRFDPQGDTSRAEVAAVLHRLHDKISAAGGAATAADAAAAGAAEAGTSTDNSTAAEAGTSAGGSAAAEAGTAGATTSSAIGAAKSTGADATNATAAAIGSPK